MAIDAHPAELTQQTGGEPQAKIPDAAEVDHRDGETSDSQLAPAGVRAAIAAGLAAVVTLTALAGWLGYRAHQSYQRQQEGNTFLQVARQGALNLTTISYTEAEADVQRILDSATGTFHDDFQNRAEAFIGVVKQAQSKSEGSITEAGLEFHDGDQAQVLLAVTVNTSNGAAAEQQPRAWRMRITVQRNGDDTKMSNVEFVP
ncbi:mammalian cell entry protein [Mycolicibacter sinensis]